MGRQTFFLPWAPSNLIRPWFNSSISLVRVAEMGFLRRVHGATLRGKVRRSEIHETLSVTLPNKGIVTTMALCGQNDPSRKCFKAIPVGYMAHRYFLIILKGFFAKC